MVIKVSTKKKKGAGTYIFLFALSANVDEVPIVPSIEFEIVGGVVPIEFVLCACEKTSHLTVDGGWRMEPTIVFSLAANPINQHGI